MNGSLEIINPEIEEQCAPRVWRRATRDFQQFRCGVVNRDEESINLIVAFGSTLNNVRITEDEWQCTCNSNASPCIHVAASSIAIKTNTFAQLSEFASETETISERISYRFITRENYLYVRRVITTSSGDVPLNSLSYQRRKQIITPLDEHVEQVLEGRFSAPIHSLKIQPLLSAISQIEGCDVRINSQLVTVSSQAAGPLCLIEDHGTGFRIRLVRDPKITSTFPSGLVIYDGELRRFDRMLSRPQYKSLIKGLVYDLEDMELLVCDVVPNLQKLLNVDVRTERLSNAKKITPRVLINSKYERDINGNIVGLTISPRIVYGSPVIAVRVHQEFNLLGQDIPIRNETIEALLCRGYERSSLSTDYPLFMDKTIPLDRVWAARHQLERAAASLESWTLAGDILSLYQGEELAPEIQVEGDTLEVTMGNLDTERVLQAWRSRQRSLLMDDGALVELPVDWLNRYGAILTELLAAKAVSEEGKLPSYALFDLARLCEGLNQPPPPRLGTLQALVSDFNQIPEPQLPADLNATLRDYQYTGVGWLQFLKRAEIGGILADDMGLGKTIQALCVLEGTSLVVAPTSILHNWLSEASTFRPALKVQLYHGTNRQIDPESTVIVTSYAILRNDIQLLREVNWSVVVLDEAQAIKNPKSLTALAAFQLQSSFRVTLTGTPIENRLTELWSQMHFLCPGLLGGERDFQRTYAAPISEGDEMVTRRLREKLKPFVLRRMKSEVAPELPKRTDVTVKCTLSDHERTVYDAIRIATQEKLVKQLAEGGFSVMGVLESLLRLRQASAHIGLLPDNTSVSSSKLEVLMSMLQDAIEAGHKSLVFSQWTSFLDKIETQMNDRGFKFVRLDGSTRNRGEVVQQFQTDPETSIFLASLKAGGTGLNLTAADHVFLMDPWWNPAVEDQAADRAHRIGQDKPVMVFKLVAENTVEERILLLQDKKRQLLEKAIGGVSAGASITKDDLLALLQ